MCCYRWFVQAHSPVCSTLELHKKSSQFFLWCGKVGGGGGVWRRGGGVVHVSGGRDLHGFLLEEGGVIWVQGSHSLGEKAVEQPGGAGSDVEVFTEDPRPEDPGPVRVRVCILNGQPGPGRVPIYYFGSRVFLTYPSRSENTAPTSDQCQSACMCFVTCSL